MGGSPGGAGMLLFKHRQACRPTAEHDLNEADGQLLSTPQTYSDDLTRLCNLPQIGGTSLFTKS